MARRYRLRIWLPDRPGALGLVASRIGAVGGDIEAVDILDRADKLVGIWRETFGDSRAHKSVSWGAANPIF